MNNVPTDQIRVTPLRPVRLEWHCQVVGCAGLLVAERGDIYGDDARWLHRCSMCGRTETASEKFPRIEHVDV